MLTEETEPLGEMAAAMNNTELEMLVCYLKCISCPASASCLTYLRFFRQIPEPTPIALSRVRLCQAGVRRGGDLELLGLGPPSPQQASLPG